MNKALRTLMKIGFGIYLAALGYVLFLWSTPVSVNGTLWRSLSLSPFSEIISAYYTDGRLVGSQFMLNMILFAPLGFLLPLMFPRAAGRLWKTAIICLGVTVTAETIQYFIGRSADIDDVIANLAGGVGGYAAYTVFLWIFSHLRGWDGFAKSERRVRLVTALAGLMGFVLIFCTPFALDATNERLTYGLFRYVSNTLPADAKIDCSLSPDAPTDTYSVYEAPTWLEELTLNALIEAVPPSGELERRGFDSTYYGHCMSAHAADGTWDATTYANGGFGMQLEPEIADMEQFKAFVQNTLDALALDGVGFAAPQYSTLDDGALCASVTPYPIGNGETVGSLNFTSAHGAVSISSTVMLVRPVDEVSVVSEADALRFARLPGVESGRYYENIVITGVHIESCEVRGRFIPCYVFTGEGTRLYDGVRSQVMYFVEACVR